MNSAGRIAELEEKLAEQAKECAQLNSETQAARQGQELQREDFKAELLKAKDEALREADERLSSESTGKLAELKKKAEQKIGLIRKQLTTQLEEKAECVRALEVQLEEIKQDMNTREKCTKKLKEQVQSLEDALAQKGELEKQVENTRAEGELETERSLQSLREMYEEKLSALQGEVASHENTIAVMQEREKEKLSSQEEMHARLEETLKKLKQAEEENTSHQVEIDRLNVQILQQNPQAPRQEVLTMTSAEPLGLRQPKAEKQEGYECSMEEEKNSVGEIDACLVDQLKSLKQDRDSLVETYELTLQDMQKQLKAYEEGSPERATADPEGLLSEMRAEQKSLRSQLSEAETEKQKLRKSFSSLQKDLRTLRKEHQVELEYLKKEMVEEYDKKLKLEMEDMEMKHSSGLKQLMREFNTQIAKKEQELESTVRETVGKAQEVEVELLENHREEASQLQKVIAQKDDDLKRTVQRYEEILQKREEEMGARVWEVQKELEELQQSTQNSPQGSLTELQAQLAQKTTLLSEARLKEQEFQETIHTLEDKFRCVHKNSVVTHLGSAYGEAKHYGFDALAEPTEFEYLRKVLFEYMMGRETKTMAKVITSVLKFPPDQTQTIMEKEDSRTLTWLR
ncbi:hypothetical protein COCON_G00011930 [Conger conger]|uniref:GRIP domain-containing protein n=2 Tax=Conger conger TaxID=82655 RepID=A0A9Q1E3C1_CONCO|nr:hypothetical protein COCON_G00011930 [Conger conger]